MVLLGAVGKHLDKTDPAIDLIADTLVDALKIPSESVQTAVADCLAPLVQVHWMQLDCRQIIAQFFIFWTIADY